MQTRRDAWLLYQQHQAALLDGTAKAWRERGAACQRWTGQPRGESQFELLSDDVVENKIVASRMALTVAEQVSQQFDPLRQRTQVLEGQSWTAPHLAGGDHLPEAGGAVGGSRVASHRFVAV